MALEITIPHPSGAQASYWRVVGVAIDAMAQAARVTLAGYVSAEARQAGKPPLDQRAFDVGPAKFAELAGAPIAEGAASTFDAIAGAAYGLAKQAKRPNPEGGPDLPGEFEEAKDV